ncbi:MAG: EAL domain-containing protein [Acidobacteria bacterium]|nr:EAL domain-containing protein [Acidobacteriota bacterium]
MEVPTITSGMSADCRPCALLEHLSDVTIVADVNGVIEYATPSVEQKFGYTQAQVIGKRFEDLVHPDHVTRAREFFAKLLTQPGANPSTELKFQHKDGETLFIENIGSNLLQDEKVGGVVINTRDVTENHRDKERLLFDAFHDTLTGLPNRALFHEHLAAALTRSRRHRKLDFAVLFIDLDRFKFVNDSLGHAAGDALLVEAAKRLTSCLRQGDTAARMGGDEFTVLVSDVKEPFEAIEVAKRIQKVFCAPFHLPGHDLVVTASIGIAIADESYSKSADLLRDADTAMYESKQNGKATHTVFHISMHENATLLMQTEADLRRAVERDEFFLLFQPIVEIRTGMISGFEALVRWRHPEKGIIVPKDFISLAEETGLIVPMTRRILNGAAMAVKQWQNLCGDSRLHVSVNISSKHFDSGDLPELVADVLNHAQLDPSHLQLEITESAMMSSIERATETLEMLKHMGVKLSLDDFGTGYSSLSYLHRFPLDFLKIDRSFVNRLGSAERKAGVLHNILTLAKTMEISTIAEGVETEEQASELTQLGCDFAQGYFYAKPLPPDRVTTLLTEFAAGARYPVMWSSILTGRSNLNRWDAFVPRGDGPHLIS